MSSRNPKRSSRLAAKEDSGDMRKRGRGESPEASPVAAPKAVPSSPATRAAEPAAPQRERRGAHAAGDAAPGANGGEGGSPVVRASQHPAGVSAAQAASARKEASFNAQLQQQQQQQSRPSGGSHSARRATEAAAPHHHPAASPHAAHAQQRAQPPPQPQPQQHHRASAPGGQGNMVPAAYSQAHAQQAHMQGMAARQQQYAHHPGMQQGPAGAVPPPAGYMAANGRRGHPEGVAGEGVRSRGDGSGQVLPGHHAHHHQGQMDPRALGGHGHHVHQTAQQQSLTEDLRKGLGGAVERWISARNLLPGEDSARFPSEIQRLVGLIAFEACDRSKGEEEGIEDQGDGFGGGVCRTETTTTRFRLAHPEVKVPFIFEATNHFFTGSLVGTEHRIESLRWKIDFELFGFLILALHTQSYEIGEEVARQKLNEVRQLLNTHISSSELGVFLMLAGNACRGASAWNDVEEVCFWTANFSLPEFRVA